MLPRVSVVTISFNQLQYLEDCIQSVLDQDGVDVEYIVVDPGSTDGSRELIERYADRIAVTVLDPDKGPADGLNRGFERSTGEVLCYVNADDRLVPGSLKFVADYFSRPGHADILNGAIRVIDESGKASLRKRTADDFDLRRYAAGICTVGQQGTFFTRDAFQRAGGFNVDNRITWDGELLVDMALAGCRFETVRKVLGDFRVYSSSLTGDDANRERQTEDINRLARKIANAGVPLYRPFTQRLLTLLYKFNPIRHLDYLLAR